MKSINKNIILVLLGFAAASCSDEDLISQGRPSVGDEIKFGANASVESVTHGVSKNSRTAYGDITGDGSNKKIAIEWCEGDQINIACDASAAVKQATYRIPYKKGGVIDGGAEGNSSVTSVLERVSEGAGLQWGEGENTFYGAYPSSMVISGKKVTGKMPSTYMAEVVETTVPGSSAKVYEVNPDMNFAYMVAKNTYSQPSAAVELSFKPIVTALEFDIVMNEYQNVSDPSIKLHNIELSSKTKSIVGNFEYDYDSQKVTNTSSYTDGTNSVLMTFDDKDRAVVLKNGDHLKATFFIIPSEGASTMAELESGDLVLKIMYEDNSKVVSFKQATVGVDIHARKKYYFGDMLMPKLKPLATSNWFAQLDDDIYISQLSFPSAGNVVSNQYKEADAIYKKEQVLPFKRLWDLGIRGFELKTSFTEKQPQGVALDKLGIARGSVKKKDNTISGYEFALSPFVCSGQELLGAGGLTLGGAFQSGYEELLRNPEETLVYLMTYQSYGGDNDYGYRPDLYLQGLQNYLDGFCQKNAITDPSQVFVQLGTESTVADLRGKIAIVVRLYDNAYVETMSSIVRNNLKPNAKWQNLLTVVNNWGTCIDNWDIRYGYGYAREGQFVNESKKEFEMNMWYGASTSSTSYNKISFADEHLAADPFPSPLLDTNPDGSYRFNVNSDYLYPDDGVSGNRSAVVQAWERVIPETKKYYLGIEDPYSEKRKNHTAYLWGEWKESLTEKVKAMKTVADWAMATRGKASSGLFLNSLAGYFPAEYTAMQGSCIPYSSTSVINTTGSSNNINFTLGGQVTGGDYSSCSGMLNAFFYGYLISRKPEEMGPLGIVLLDYIGAVASDFSNIASYSVSVPGVSVAGVTSAQAEAASIALPRLIIANNFRFALTKKAGANEHMVTTTQTSSSQKMQGDGNIIRFK